VDHRPIRSCDESDWLDSPDAGGENQPPGTDPFRGGERPAAETG